MSQLLNYEISQQHQQQAPTTHIWLTFNTRASFKTFTCSITKHLYEKFTTPSLNIIYTYLTHLPTYNNVYTHHLSCITYIYSGINILAGIEIQLYSLILYSYSVNDDYFGKQTPNIASVIIMIINTLKIMENHAKYTPDGDVFKLLFP